MRNSCLAVARAELEWRLPAFSALSVQLEQLEAKLADGADIDIAEYTSLTSILVRVVSRLGINRVARDIGPTLSDIIRGPPP